MIEKKVTEVKKRLLYPGDGSYLNLVTINVNGLRTKLKKDLLGKLLIDLQVGVCIKTDSHLGKPEVKDIQYPKYNVLVDTPVGEPIKGGVLILVHANFSAEEIPKMEELTKTIDHCLREDIHRLIQTRPYISWGCISGRKGRDTLTWRRCIPS